MYCTVYHVQCLVCTVPCCVLGCLVCTVLYSMLCTKLSSVYCTVYHVMLYAVYCTLYHVVRCTMCYILNGSCFELGYAGTNCWWCRGCRSYVLEITDAQTEKKTFKVSSLWLQLLLLLVWIMPWSISWRIYCCYLDELVELAMSGNSS